jgi:hypothetical protein
MMVSVSGPALPVATWLPSPSRNMYRAEYEVVDCVVLMVKHTPVSRLTVYASTTLPPAIWVTSCCLTPLE